MTTLARFVLRRTVLMAVTAWAVLSLAFVVFAVKPDMQVWFVLWGAGPSQEAQRQALEAYRQAHNYDVPLFERYARWMVDYATLRWGTTLDGIPIAALIADALGETLTYLLPALVVSTVVAHALGVYMALRRGGLADKLGTVLAYGGYGVPAFFAAELAFGVLVHRYGMLWLELDTARAHQGVIVPPGVDEYLLPGAILTVHLVAIQLVFIRSEVADRLNEGFMKTFRASGARQRDLARHAIRNALVPLLSSFFAQVLTVIYLDVIAVEVAIGPSGFGRLTFNAFTNQDLGLILGVTLVPVLVGLVGNFAQDVASVALDPRVEFAGGRGLGLPVRAEAVAAAGVVAIVVVAAAAATLGGLPALGGGGPTSVGATTTPEPDLTVRVGYQGPWHLTLEQRVNGTWRERELSGRGNEVLDLDPATTRVRAAARKRDGGTTRLTLQVARGRTVVDSAGTTEPYGFVDVDMIL